MKKNVYKNNYSFGAAMPGRSFVGANGYRYGFNGKENDNEVKGNGNQQDYGMRIYDSRLGRFLSADPLIVHDQQYPELSPYQFASNCPIYMVDIDGLEGNGYMHNVPADEKWGVINSMNESYGKVLMGVGSASDINDATVLTTWWTRSGKAINLDQTEANGWDKTFAVAGAAIPLVSGSLIKQSLKGTLKGAEWSYNAMKYGNKVADAINGAASGALRQALNKAGVTLLEKEAHHIIPTQLLKDNKVIQDAVNGGFDFNGLDNGIGLSKVAEGGVHANHPNYTKQVDAVLTKWAESNKGYSPADAKKFIEGYSSKLRNMIEKESVEGGTKVNKLELE